MDSEKCSRRRRPRTTERAAVIFLPLFLATCFAAAQDGEPRALDPDAKALASGDSPLEAFLERVQSLSAEFTQELWSSEQELVETSEGALRLERPNRFEWHYRAPIEQRILADGERLWMYDIELEQVTVTGLDELGEANPAMLLGGDRGVRDSFDVVESFERDGRDWVRLEPKAAGGDFSSISIALRDGAPEVLEFVDGLGQTTHIAFSEIEINPPFEAGAFEFEPPPGVDVIGEGG